MQFEQIKKQISDTYALIDSSRKLLQTEQKEIATFLLEQDTALLKTLQYELRDLIISKINQFIPIDINSANDLLEYTYKTLNVKVPIDPFEIAKHFNIQVTKERYLNDSIGHSSFNGEQIFISYRPSQEYRDRFTIAHELGHIFLHFAKGLDYIFVDRTQDMYAQDESNQDTFMEAARYGLNGNKYYEEEANSFAAELLVPKRQLEHVLSLIPKGKTMKLTMLREYFKASKQVLLISLNKYDLINSGKIVNNIDEKPWS